jgi:hypothetical protein
MIKLMGLAVLAFGLSLHFIEWLFEFRGNGWSFATVLSIVVLFERLHHNHQTRVMLKIIGEKVGVSWESSLRKNGLKVPRLFFKKPFLFLHMDTKHPNQRRMKKMLLALRSPWSKKLFAFIVLVLLNGLNDTLQLHLSPDTISRVSTVGMTYIVSQAGVDALKPLIMLVLARFSTPQTTVTLVGGTTDAKPTGDSGAAV